MTMRISRTAVLTLVALCTVAALAVGVAAQESAGMSQASGLARQSLRPYWHVFAAYTLVIVLVGGWAVTIARRLRGLEERLRD
jgi:CcmD family protein